MNNSIDLHMHSRYSDDGEFTPTELVEKCVASGIQTMSITGGSDFHGKTKPAIALGQHGCLISENELISSLKKYFALDIDK